VRGASRRRTRKFASGVAQRPQSIGRFAFFVRRDRPPDRHWTSACRCALSDLCSAFAAQCVATVRDGVIERSFDRPAVPADSVRRVECGRRRARFPERMRGAYGGNERLSLFVPFPRPSARGASRAATGRHCQGKCCRRLQGSPAIVVIKGARTEGARPAAGRHRQGTQDRSVVSLSVLGCRAEL
jgi:hypothetical protein